MLTKNGGLFYGTLINSSNLSAVLVDINGDTVTGNVTCARTTGSGNSTASENNSFINTSFRTFARVGYGKTLPTINDYNTEQELDENNVNINDILMCGNADRKINGFIQTGQSSYIGKSSDGAICYEFTFYNKTDNDIIFYEIGMFVNTTPSAPIFPFMVARCVNTNGWVCKKRDNITLIIEINFACKKAIVNYGGRYFSNLLTRGVYMYGILQYNGNVPTGSISAEPYGSTGNTQAITSNTYATTSPPGMFCRLGVGQTENNMDMYSLEDEVIPDSNETNVNDVVRCAGAQLIVDNINTGKWTYRYTFVNDGDEAITCYEIGLFNKQSAAIFLVGRKVITGGIRIESGASKTIDFTINICGATNDVEASIVNE